MKIRIKKGDAKEALLKESTRETVKTINKEKTTKEDAKKVLKEGKVVGKLEAKGGKAKGGKTRTPSVGSKEKQQELKNILGEVRASVEAKGCRIYEAANGTVARVFTSKSKGQQVGSEGFICEINTTHLHGLENAVCVRPENRKFIGGKDATSFGTLTATPYTGKSQIISLVKEIKG